jgi:hypothetical protein
LIVFTLIQKRNIALQPVKKTKDVRFSERFSFLVESIIATQGGYLADELFSLEGKADHSFKFKTVQKNDAVRLRWLILSREHYFETSKVYPIANKKELKQAIRFDDDKAPVDGLTLHYIERIDEQNHRVTFWVLNLKILEAYNLKPWLILPESYVLAHALSDNINIASIDCINKTLFISNTEQGLFTGIQSTQTPDLENFAFSTGSPISAEGEKHFDSNDFINLLSKGLRSLNVKKLQGLVVNLNRVKLNTYPWKLAAVISTTVFTVYLSLSSIWLLYKEHQLTQNIDSQKSQVEQALILQRTYQQQLQWQKLLSAPTDNMLPYWHTWSILFEAIDVGAKFKTLTYRDRTVTLNGTANETIKATDILAKLSDNPHVQSASFSQSLRVYRGKEDFVISFSFVEKRNVQTEQSKTQQDVD